MPTQIPAITFPTRPHQFPASLKLPENIKAHTNNFPGSRYLLHTVMRLQGLYSVCHSYQTSSSVLPETMQDFSGLQIQGSLKADLLSASFSALGPQALTSQSTSSQHSSPTPSLTHRSRSQHTARSPLSMGTDSVPLRDGQTLSGYSSPQKRHTSSLITFPLDPWVNSNWTVGQEMFMY